MKVLPARTTLAIMIIGAMGIHIFILVLVLMDQELIPTAVALGMAPLYDQESTMSTIVQSRYMHQ